MPEEFQRHPAWGDELWGQRGQLELEGMGGEWGRPMTGLRARGRRQAKGVEAVWTVGCHGWVVSLLAEGSGGLHHSNQLWHLSAGRFDRVFTFPVQGNQIVVSPLYISV